MVVDHLCDLGRSLPKDGDPNNCPEGQKEIAEWILDLKFHLTIRQRINMVGYSYGSFLASQVALANPNEVGKLPQVYLPRLNPVGCSRNHCWYREYLVSVRGCKNQHEKLDLWVNAGGRIGRVD